ncbi:translation initiation factor IF-2-like [Phyllostomus hastatus]|uniref:translation initiation factor IF-2-like n=1 Tax=Phyllostomus hastatus TaxID=9423 RepID=UPI001E67F124|nr:translation initiation factor IF-2-like [Phyllostomus hastatus]
MEFHGSTTTNAGELTARGRTRLGGRGERARGCSPSPEARWRGPQPQTRLAETRRAAGSAGPSSGAGPGGRRVSAELSPRAQEGPGRGPEAASSGSDPVGFSIWKARRPGGPWVGREGRQRSLQAEPARTRWPRAGAVALTWVHLNPVARYLSPSTAARGGDDVDMPAIFKKKNQNRI